MTRLSTIFTTVCTIIVCASGASPGAIADDYVWTRTVWGSSNVNGHYSSMSNGYGGYYVPRNAYGNNYEAQGNFTNPQGYIVPAGTPVVQQTVPVAQQTVPVVQQAAPVVVPQVMVHRRRHWRR